MAEKIPNCAGPRTRARIMVKTKPMTAVNPKPMKLIKVSLTVAVRRIFFNFSTSISYLFLDTSSKDPEEFDQEEFPVPNP